MLYAVLKIFCTTVSKQFLSPDLFLFFIPFRDKLNLSLFSFYYQMQAFMAASSACKVQQGRIYCQVIPSVAELQMDAFA